MRQCITLWTSEDTLLITGIAAQKKKSRYNIFVDGAYWGGISSSVLAAHNLYVKKEVNAEILKQVFWADIETRIYERCIRVIGLRPRSFNEMRRYVEQVIRKNKVMWLKGSWYEDDMEVLLQTGKIVLDRLSDQGLIDDEEFARWWVEQRTRSGMKGWQVIRAELLGKGVDSMVVDHLRISTEGELELARKAYEKIMRRVGMTKEKCIRRLLSRGFPWDIVQKIVQYENEDGIPLD